MIGRSVVNNNSEQKIGFKVTFNIKDGFLQCDMFLKLIIFTDMYALKQTEVYEHKTLYKHSYTNKKLL